MENYIVNWYIFCGLGFILLLLLRSYGIFSKFWQSFMLLVLIVSGKQLFKCVMVYTPGNVPEEEREVKALLFSNDVNYMDDVMEIFESKNRDEETVN